VLFFLFTFFVIVPIFTWLLYFRSKGGGGSESKKFLLKVFIWGILASAVALFIELEVVQFVFPNNSDQVLNYSLAGLKKIDFNIFFSAFFWGAERKS
jgi:RsiW-degrading membrane proteinase PrsW (M82 family)